MSPRVLNLQGLEIAYSLNFNSYLKNLVEFTYASWNLSSMFITETDSIKKLNPKQKVIRYMIGKSLRLLRSIKSLTEIGYWPEAEILVRAMVETEALLLYVLKDKTNKTANKWLNRKNPKERWDWTELTKELPTTFRTMYTNLSLYPHNHVLSTISYTHLSNGLVLLQRGPLGGNGHNEKAEQVLGFSALLNSALCEIGTSQFKLSKDWQEKHIEFEKMPYFLTIKERLQKKDKT